MFTDDPIIADWLYADGETAIPYFVFTVAPVAV
jgi:hypothetical protein